jgi:hypothetical protein
MRQERSAHTMLSGPYRDLAAGAEEMEMHRLSVLSAPDPQNELGSGQTGLRKLGLLPGLRGLNSYEFVVRR